MNFMKIATLAFIFVLNISFAHEEHDEHLFAPEHNYVLDEGDVNDVTKEMVQQRIDKALKIFRPIAKEKFGQRLHIENLWKSSTVNARASRVSIDGEKVLKVEMFGGISKHYEATIDSTTAIICHEIGHHMGGAPKIGGINKATKWATNEGQSDYWATLKCLRKMFQDDDNVSIMKKRTEIYQTTKDLVRKKVNEVDSFALQKCEGVYKSEPEAYLCYRLAMAGLKTSRVLMSLKFGYGSLARRWFPSRVEKGMPKFKNQDKSKVSKTNNRHPAAQCRLDTYFAGALCDKPIDEDVDALDPNIGACSIANGDKIGVRPACWLKS